MQIRNGVYTFPADEIETGQISDFKFASRKLLLFVVIVLYSRNKSFPRNPYSRVSKNSSSVSKLETRYSKLEPRNSILDSRKHRGSRIEFRVETVNLLLPGTVVTLF